MPLCHLYLDQPFYSPHKIVKCGTHFFVSWVRKQGKLRAIAGVVEEKAKCIIVLG